MDERVRMEIHIIRMVAAIFPYLCFGKKSHSWSNTEWLPNVLLKRLDGCKLEQFEASRHRGRSGRKVLVVRMLGQLSVRTIYHVVRADVAWLMSVRMEYHVVRMDSRDPISLTWNLCISLKKTFENWLNPWFKSVIVYVTDWWVSRLFTRLFRR